MNRAVPTSAFNALLDGCSRLAPLRRIEFSYRYSRGTVILTDLPDTRSVTIVCTCSAAGSPAGASDTVVSPSDSSPLAGGGLVQIGFGGPPPSGVPSVLSTEVSAKSWQFPVSLLAWQPQKRITASTERPAATELTMSIRAMSPGFSHWVMNVFRSLTRNRFAPKWAVSADPVHGLGGSPADAATAIADRRKTIKAVVRIGCILAACRPTDRRSAASNSADWIRPSLRSMPPGGNQGQLNQYAG